MRETFSYDPYSTLVGMTDEAFMTLYSHTRRNLRRIVHLALAIVPLLALLVGSCKTSQTTAFNDAQSVGPAQFRQALFPDRPQAQNARYIPAAGYVSQARGYVEDQPQTMLMLTRDEVGYIFGKPSFERRDADAQISQYKTGACVVNFYFYGHDAASYVDVRIKDGDDAFRAEPASPEEISACLRHIDAQDFKTADL